MRKIIIVITILFTSIALFGQDENTALQYSRNIYEGSARFNAMGGAFTALGGDFGSIMINPAGLGVYRGSEFAFTTNLFSSSVKSDYFNTTYEESNLNIGFNNIGVVLSFGLNDADTRWTRVNLAIGYNQVRNFNYDLTAIGTNTENSILDYFVNNANAGIWADNYEGLAYETYLMNYDTVLNEYWSFVTDERNANPGEFEMNQEKYIDREGYINDVSFALSGSYGDFLFVGASVGISTLSYTEFASHYEYENNDTSFYDFHNMEFIEYFHEEGTGINLKVGAIYTPAKFFRFGVSVHTPTLYSNRYSLENRMISNFDNGDNFDITMVGDDYSYALTTPWRINAGVGFVLGKFAIISADYEYVDYSEMDLSDGDGGENFLIENQYIDQSYGQTHNLRMGAELKFNAFYLRGGYAMYDSPYHSNQMNANLNKKIISAGIGFRTDNYFLDFAYTNTAFNKKNILYLDNSDNPVDSDFSFTKYYISFGYKF